MSTTVLDRAFSTLCISLPLFVGAACSGGSGGGGGGDDSGAVDVFLTDAPLDDLLAFRARVKELRLVRVGGEQSENLLAGPVDVEFVGLEETLFWAASATPAPGSFEAVRVVFEPGFYEAVTRMGELVAVAASAHELIAPLAAPVAFDGKNRPRLAVDLDLAASLAGDVAAPPIQFTPAGSTSSDDGPGLIDEIRGVVSSVQQGASTFVLDAFTGSGADVPIGPVTVRVLPTTMLLGNDSQPLSGAPAFFALLSPGATWLEVHGIVQPGGNVNATAIEVEDGPGGSGSQGKVRIQGLVASIGPGQAFDMTIQKIKKGASIALPVLEGLGSPTTIRVSYGPATFFHFDDDSGSGGHEPTTAESLAVGVKVKVRFADFIAEPFPAQRVEIDRHGPEFEGTITDVSGLPAGFVMRLRPGEPAIQSGEVASTSTDVEVAFGSGPLFLDTPGKPPLVANDLVSGLRVRVRGTLSGPPTSPSIAANRVKIRAGRLDDALVNTVAPGEGSFTTIGGDLDKPFGGGATPGPFTILIEPGAVFDDDASSAASFFALFQSLGDGETLEVRVEGIGTDMPDRLRAFHVRARVRD